MLHVVLDTNIYRQCWRRNSSAFRALYRAARTGEVKVHIPFIVREELRTQLQREIGERLSKIKKAARAIAKMCNSEEIGKHADHDLIPAFRTKLSIFSA